MFFFLYSTYTQSHTLSCNFRASIESELIAALHLFNWSCMYITLSLREGKNKYMSSIFRSYFLKLLKVTPLRCILFKDVTIDFGSIGSKNFKLNTFLILVTRENIGGDSYLILNIIACVLKRPF